MSQEGTSSIEDDDVQAVYDAPSDLVADVLSELLGGAVNQAEEPDIIEIDDDDDDEIVIVEDTKTEEARREARKEKANEFLSWLIRLKPEHFERVKINRTDYVKQAVTETPVIDPVVCKKIANEYKEINTLEGLAEAFDLASDDMVIVAICIGVLEVENELDLDLTPLCDDRIDEWSIQRAKHFLNLPASGVSARYGPLKLMQYSLTSPAQLVLLLTVVWLQDNGFPCRLEFEKAPMEMPVRVDLYDLSQSIVDTAVQYWNDRTADGELVDQMSKELNNFFQELETTSSEISSNIQRITQENNGGLPSSKFDDYTDYDDDEVTAMSFMDPDQRHQINRATESLASLKAQLQALTEAAEEVYSKKSEFAKMLVMTPGEFCLARSVEKDDAPMSVARVVEHVDAATYRVKFVDSNRVQNVSIRDLALTTFGMEHPIFHVAGDVGLRVAVPQTIQVSQYKRKTLWYSGTTAGRRHAHKGDYLVFLDNGTDSYVTVPGKPTDDNYEAATAKLKENCSLDELITKLDACQMAVMVGQPLTADGLLDRNRTAQWIRPPVRAAYIRDFMKEFPEWQLLRMPIGMRINVFQSLTDRRKVPVTVVGQDRVFAVVRADMSRAVPGFDCLDYPCKKGHQHKDEFIYRGSHRLEGAAHKKELLTANNNLSMRRKVQFASLFEPTEMERTMPVRMRQQTSRRRGDVAGERVVAEDGRHRDVVEQRKVKQNMFEKTIVKTPVLLPLGELLPHEQCGPDCLHGLDSDPYDSKFHRCSPLQAPLMCGWRRKKVTMKGVKKRSPIKKLIIYYAPCGKPLNSMVEVSDYLRDTRSMLTIDCFSFEDEVDTETFVVVDEKFVKIADFSGGVEGIPIPLVNTVDDEPPPVLEYSKRRFQYDQTVNLSSINRDFCSGCSCDGDCSDVSKCECQQLSIESMNRLPKTLQYNGRDKMVPHYTNRVLYNKVISGMYECNDQCSCHRKACHNRVVQNNIKYPMQIFKTAQSGWGVRALTDIPEGSFICNYVGALLTNDLADQLKNDDQYFADLDLKDAVEMNKIREDTETDFGFGDEVEDEYSDKEDEEAGVDEDAADKEVVMREGKHLVDGEAVQTRGTRRKELEEKEKEGEEEKKDDEEGEPEEGVGAEKSEDVFNWDNYFKESALFVVDAKTRGNLGRFLNHSCDPNVQVQHVMYDTHDLRLPWVAFFTTRAVKAGDELCWDYAYTLLNPDVERLSCYCGAPNCRLRLL